MMGSDRRRFATASFFLNDFYKDYYGKEKPVRDVI